MKLIQAYYAMFNFIDDRSTFAFKLFRLDHGSDKYKDNLFKVLCLSTVLPKLSCNHQSTSITQYALNGIYAESAINDPKQSN